MVWKLDSELNCPFDELFDPIPGLESVDNQKVVAAPHHEAIGGSRGLLKKVKPLVFLVKKARKIRKSFRNMSKIRISFGEDDIEYYSSRPAKLVKLARKYDLHIDTFSRFFRGEDDFMDFHPSAEIRKGIEQLLLQTRNVVGVHIRTSDNDPSCATTHGSILKWIATIKSIYQSDPSVAFFVASNYIQVEDRIEQELPGCVIRQPKSSYARDNPEGVKHAAIDLFCLASCKRLIGSNHSSFTDTAREIGKMPCELLG
jgi:hypothetical protein